MQRTFHWRPAGAAALVYSLVAALYTRPLLEQSRTAILSDPFDPILNTSILWWNATVVPFTRAWWTPPWFHPSTDIGAFTENLAGLGAIATPLLWLTGDPVFTYNLTLFLSWPLSALAGYLLAWYLLGRHDAAFLAGLLFAFAPYRLAQIAHVQVLSMYWLPVALLALHAYLADGRRRWLVLFGVAWLLQSLTNGYFMLFSAVMIGLWLLYFGSPRSAWRATAAILATWVVTSLPLVPVMLRYREIHERYGLTRGLDVARAFGAEPAAFASISNLTWFWPRMLGDAGVEFNLFPGATGLLLVMTAVIVFLFVSRRTTSIAVTDRSRRFARAGLGIVAAIAVIAALVTAAIGPWRLSIAGVTVRMSGIGRAVAIVVVAGLACLVLTPSIWQRLRQRSTFAFYAGATVLCLVFACGPEIRVGTHVLLEPAPYRWLMMFVPGFEGLRVPARFWMVGTLYLAIAAAAAFAWLAPRRGRARVLALALAVAGVALDAWPHTLPIATPPALWRPPDPAGDSAVIELPLGPEWDAAATFRSVGHRRRVVNGVSGHDPPHYLLLQMGLNGRDPGVLEVLAEFGPLDIIVNGDADPDGSLLRYATGVPGAVTIATDGPRTIVRLLERPAPAAGRRSIPIVAATANADEARVPLCCDGNTRTQWQDGPQREGQWMQLDLGAVHTVAGIEHAIARDILGFPRRLIIDVSTDGQAWQRVWAGPTLAAAFRGAVLQPTDITFRIAFASTPARYVRLSQTGQFDGGWAVAEIRVMSADAR